MVKRVWISGRCAGGFFCTGFMVLVVFQCFVAGCGGGNRKVGGSICDRLQHESPSVRIQAAMDAVREKDMKALPLLVDRLTDRESSVRVFAAQALRRMTGKDFGWNSWDPPGVRRAAVRKWRQWLETEAREKKDISTVLNDDESR